MCTNLICSIFDIQKCYIFYLGKSICPFKISAFGDMFEKFSSSSMLYKYLSIFSSIFLDLNLYSKWNLFFEIDVIKALNIYFVVASSLIENSLFYCFENSTFIKN